MPAHPVNKYYLKDLYKEIDLFARKIAHCTAYKSFDTEEDGAQEARKLQAKRNVLVKVASELVNKGVEYDVKDLARSYRQGPTGSPGSHA